MSEVSDSQTCKPRMSAPPRILISLDRVPQHCEEVTHRACEDEQVPHEMAIPHALGRVERDARRVRESTGNEPEPARHRQAKPQRSNRDQGEPPHAEIQRGGEPRIPNATHRLQGDAENARLHTRLNSAQPHAPRSTPSVKGV